MPFSFSPSIIICGSYASTCVSNSWHGCFTAISSPRFLLLLIFLLGLLLILSSVWTDQVAISLHPSSSTICFTTLACRSFEIDCYIDGDFLATCLTWLVHFTRIISFWLVIPAPF